jgi:hypothetical protein
MQVRPPVQPFAVGSLPYRRLVGVGMRYGREFAIRCIETCLQAWASTLSLVNVMPRNFRTDNDPWQVQGHQERDHQHRTADDE